ncbi:hypothetical protein BC829DRAFT_254583 [Chytridium lagenaria]|nr:hypothetical protein BC829DRAFT_254583 [Chytridium lagenaria]
MGTTIAMYMGRGPHPLNIIMPTPLILRLLPFHLPLIIPTMRLLPFLNMVHLTVIHINPLIIILHLSLLLRIMALLLLMDRLRGWGRHLIVRRIVEEAVGTIILHHLCIMVEVGIMNVMSIVEEEAGVDNGTIRMVVGRKGVDMDGRDDTNGVDIVFYSCGYHLRWDLANKNMLLSSHALHFLLVLYPTCVVQAQI